LVAKDIESISKNCYCLYLAEIESGNSSGALTAYREHIAWRDSLVNQRKTFNLARAEVKTTFARKSVADSLIYKHQLDLQSRNYNDEIRKQKEILGIISIGMAAAALAAIIFFLVWRLIRKKNLLLRKQHELIEARNRDVTQALGEKEILLKEIHHRVKNNLQLVSSLLDLQSGEISDSRVRNVFNTSQNRVAAIALIHQMLYEGEKITTIAMKQYIPKLASEISEAIGNAIPVSHQIEVDDIQLDVEKAIPVGLIVNELVTNSYKYAFQGRNHGKLNISLKIFAGNYNLSVEDDGPGIPGNSMENSRKSLGLQLVNGLARQLKGKVEISSIGGMKVKIVF